MSNSNLQITINAKNNASPSLAKVGMDLDAVAKKGEKTGKSIRDVGDNLTGKVTVPLTVMGLASTKAFSDLREAVNATNVIFGGASNILLDYSKTAVRSAGLSERAFLEASVPIGASLQNMGFSAEDAAKKTIDLTERAADLASVHNTTLADALSALQSGLRGETEQMLGYGSALFEAELKSYALAEGIYDGTGEMTQQEKTVARLGKMFQDTDKVQGDFVETSDELANKTRILVAETENQSVAIGERLSPAMDQLVDVGLELLESFEKLPAPVKDFGVKAAVVTAIVGPLLIGLGTMIVLGAKLIPIFIGAGAVIGAVSLPVLAVGAAIAAVIIGIAAFIMNFEKITSAARSAGASLRDNFNVAINWVNDKLSGFNPAAYLQSIPARISESLAGLFNSITKPFGDAINWVNDKLGSFKPKIPSLGGAVSGLRNILPFATGGDFMTSGPQLIMVGDNPGGRERVTVTPTSSPNINGPKAGSGGSVNITNNYNIQNRSDAEFEARRTAQLISLYS